MTPNEDRDWWRGNPIEVRDRLARAMETGNSRDLMMDKVYVGQAALKLMSGVARRGDAALVLATMIQRCEVEVRACTEQLLALPDPGSPEARELHFEARVAAAIISHINQLVEDGEHAAATINAQGQPA